MAYYDKKIGKYCLTKEEMETLPKNEAKARLGKGLLACGALIAGGVAIPTAVAVTGLGAFSAAVIGGSVIGGYMILTGLVNVGLQIRDYFRNNKRLEYDETEEKNR